MPLGDECCCIQMHDASAVCSAQTQFNPRVVLLRPDAVGFSFVPPSTEARIIVVAQAELQSCRWVDDMFAAEILRTLIEFYDDKILAARDEYNIGKDV
jgi:hypothetical protein